jgi:hypothetical protein
MQTEQVEGFEPTAIFEEERSVVRAERAGEGSRAERAEQEVPRRASEASPSHSLR